MPNSRQPLDRVNKEANILIHELRGPGLPVPPRQIVKREKGALKHKSQAL